MSAPAQNGPRWRNSPFGRQSPKESQSPSSSNVSSKSALFSSSPSTTPPVTSNHVRQQSFSPMPPASQIGRVDSLHRRSTSQRNNAPTTATFAPQFIKSDEIQNGHKIHGIEGENDFSGKHYVWLKDPEKAFVRGWVVQELPENRLLVQCDDGSQRDVHEDEADKVNPAKFDKADDMAELTHLNEASVVHNLHMRYQADLIYTYSGLFLVTINPYCPLPIYSREYINMYRGRSREDTKPHIFAMADEAFRNLVEEGKNQSILVTGESGAGKTENTKKVIQYLAAVATSDTPRAAKSGGKQLSNLSEQILRANPILEAFGNAQTSRNNNSSRFGKFIRVQFTRSGQIAGAFIDWYLLEKSRVVKLNSQERNYHIFYQLLRGADRRMKHAFLLDGLEMADFEYTKQGNDTITGVSDQDEWNSLIEAFHIMGFSEQDQTSILKTVAAILHLGNITVKKESIRADQAALEPESELQAAKVCQLLGIDANAFIQALLHPRVKAGREIVEKVQTPEQVALAIDALAKGIYERGFGNLVDRINRQLDRGFGSDDSQFIGVLDIAGFEIFEQNSFEQLCINYTNEKLQQFFNHHMFVLEQEEYAREQIEWKFIDFGKDLQPTIDLIELTNPIGIFSCLDEDCVMPKATDVTFTDKLHGLWDRKTPKYRSSMLNKGFILTHYAAEVEYSTDGWLEKNKDPLPDNITRMLAKSSDKHISQLFADCADPDDEAGGTRSRVKKGLFRTVAQRHKEQLSTLMNQLHQTHPHFVRCILPNHKKRPKLFNASLVLDQLRCNGVLEGIRIARTGFPNRIPFAEFRQRYEVLCSDMPKIYLDGQTAAQLMLEKLNMDRSYYRVGLTKVFFRAGVLAELEERRDKLISAIMTRFQCVARGYIQRHKAYKQLYRAEATRIVHENFRAYIQLQNNPWWRLFVRMKPLLGATRQAQEMKRKQELITGLQQQIHLEEEKKQHLEEERRRAENEIHRVQQVLESERALALDKEEIFKRLQNREAELAEKLAGAIEDQEALEDQLDALIEAKKRVEGQATERQQELEQAGEMIVILEGEKQRLSQQVISLEHQLSTLEQAKSLRSAEEEKLGQEIKMLMSQLSLKERKLQDLETKMLKTDQDLDIKLAASTRDLAASKKQVKELLDENRQVRQQLTELSGATTSFEDLIRRKESKLSVLRSENRKVETDRKTVEDERQKLMSRCEMLQSRLRDAQAEVEGLSMQKRQLEQDVSAAKVALETHVTNDQDRKRLEQQIDELRDELVQVQKDLTRERQSRDDVEMLSNHKYNTLKAEFDSMNEAKITIEKEMYAHQDVLRRATEGKAAVDRERKELQTEIRALREKYIKLQEERMESESVAERNLAKVANERQAALRKEIEARNKQLEELDAERAKLADQVQGLSRIIADGDQFRLRHDAEKERLERELVTVKGRLTASENDNKALLNKVQQKNLDIARSNSRASDSQRTRVTQLTGEKAKAEEEAKKLRRQLDDVQLTVTSLEKQKEKLELSLEDLTHEVNREHKTSRNAEKQSSTANLQLAEVNRKLETEQQLRAQAQSNTRAMQSSLDNANSQIAEHQQQLSLLQKLFDPTPAEDADQKTGSRGVTKPDLIKLSDLASKFEQGQHALRVANERCMQMEAQLSDLRAKHGEDLAQIDAKHTDSKRALLEEMTSPQLNSRQIESPQMRRANENRKPFSPITTPSAQRHISKASVDSTRSDRTVDTVTFNNRMDLASELELVQNQLQMSEMRNKHLQSQLDRSPARRGWEEDSPSVRRMQKLERENNRLNDMLDDSAKKISSLEHSVHIGQLSFKEVQTKSHEELFDLITSQEQGRKQLAQAHTGAINDLADVKSAYDAANAAKMALDAELKNMREDFNNLKYEREQETARHAQLLEEFSDLQIRLDGESGKLLDVESSLSLYKTRADDYFNKLEQAEITVLRATRAEQFARQQGREMEDQCAVIMAERKNLDEQIEDLQRQTQQYEERIEDLSADLDGAIQAKKRLQNELEDYRAQRAVDIEDKDMSFEQTRKKYQYELSSLSTELEMERESVLASREENTRLRDEIEELRSKWDDEVLNSTSWSKEKQRLDVTLQELSSSRDEAVAAHNESQSKIVGLLSQVRGLRSDLDDAAAEHETLSKEKKTLESRVTEMKQRLDELAHGETPSVQEAAARDAEFLSLKARYEQQEDVLSVAVGKMRRAEALAQEISKDMQVERETNVLLHKEKAALEKTLKDLQLRLIDAETKGSSSAGQDVRFLHGRIQELEKSLEAAESARTLEARSVRTVDRTVKDLQSQIDRREKQISNQAEDLNKARDKISSLLATIDDLQASDSAAQLSAKRAERDLREEKERTLRLEREVEGWKGLRFERGSQRGGSGLLAPGLGGKAASEMGGSVRGRTRETSLKPDDAAVTAAIVASASDAGAGAAAQAVNRPLRRVSGTKGFL